jgi:hypothetical protein
VTSAELVAAAVGNGVTLALVLVPALRRSVRAEAAAAASAELAELVATLPCRGRTPAGCAPPETHPALSEAKCSLP